MGFASKRKRQAKFLSELNHRFDGYVHPAVVVSALSEATWSSPALVFMGSGEFGVPFDSLREAWQSSDQSLGVLAITADARHGIWCDHDRYDDSICIALAP